jgi:hypothetical protein
MNNNEDFDNINAVDKVRLEGETVFQAMDLLLFF